MQRTFSYLRNKVWAREMEGVSRNIRIAVENLIKEEK